MSNKTEIKSILKEAKLKVRVTENKLEAYIKVSYDMNFVNKVDISNLIPFTKVDQSEDWSTRKGYLMFKNN